MTQLRYWRTYGVLLLSCASLSLSGCFLRAFYPESYDASDFEEFQFRLKAGRSCQDSLIAGSVCEATITRQASGEYFVVLTTLVDDESDSTNLVERTMTESEAGRMLELFGELRINLSPRPFCFIVVGIPEDLDSSYRWDDFELIVYDCDRPRLDYGQAGDIGGFLRSLVADQTDGTAEASDE